MNNTRTIKDFPNYEISEDGVIFNTKTNRIVTHQLRNTGYVAVWLKNGNIRKIRSLHKVLLESFIPNVDNLPCIDHIDRDKTNNTLENLRYCSFAENSRNRPRTFFNKLGKHISNSNPPYYRISIINKGKRVYDKNFCKSKYSLRVVRAIRNNALFKLGLPSLDEKDLDIVE